MSKNDIFEKTWPVFRCIATPFIYGTAIIFTAATFIPFYIGMKVANGKKYK